LDDPLKLVGMAIHDAKAGADESSDQTHFVTTDENKQASVNVKDIYAKR
jgi:poly-gamma-glutamate capsule biosynthesis protein CapA/YwtB (metallophosphatase superfamily)